MGLLCVASTSAQGIENWKQGQGFRWRDVSFPTSGHTGFTLMSPQLTGISFSNHLSDVTAAKNRILEIGSGVALGDVDGDGWCDIYFCRL
jgi:hypothetical protein